jgi:hypothetical protein
VLSSILFKGFNGLGFKESVLQEALAAKSITIGFQPIAIDFVYLEIFSNKGGAYEIYYT